MLKSIAFLFLFVFATQNLHAQMSFRLELTDVEFEYFIEKHDRVTFLNLHHNEQTSIEAAKIVLKKRGGKFIGILSGMERWYSILKKDKSKITFDPNRVFSKKGIAATLDKHDCHSAYNIGVIEKFSRILLNRITAQHLLVALHNNTDGEYSIESYAECGSLECDAAMVFLNPARDPDDFFFVTEVFQFDYFKNRGFNVALQDNRHVSDDGSLSVFCGKNNIHYINVECENGHLEEQIEMIEEIYKYLDFRKKARGK